jgi:hypothetical protein
MALALARARRSLLVYATLTAQSYGYRKTILFFGRRYVVPSGEHEGNRG